MHDSHLLRIFTEYTRSAGSTSNNTDVMKPDGYANRQSQQGFEPDCRAPLIIHRVGTRYVDAIAIKEDRNWEASDVDPCRRHRLVARVDDPPADFNFFAGCCFVKEMRRVCPCDESV